MHEELIFGGSRKAFLASKDDTYIVVQKGSSFKMDILPSI